MIIKLLVAHQNKYHAILWLEIEALVFEQKSPCALNILLVNHVIILLIIFYDICIDIVSFDSPVCLCWDMNARADICFGIRDNDDYIVNICENIIHNNDSSK